MDSFIGVLGSRKPERSARDKQLQATFGCNAKEGYRIEPRTAHDLQMLKEFNQCGKEGYNRAKYVDAKNLNENYCGGYANIMDDPYNSSPQVQYVALR